METTNHHGWEHVGPYRIHNRIGAGGYAEVFAGVDTRSGLRVALKRLRLKHRGDPDSRDRFEREGLALEAINHPNIVRCFGILVQEDEVWIVMELLRGVTLRQLLRDRGPLSVERALLIAIDVADGLADMHEMAIVHRDLKPENVFLTLPSYQVKIVDLGVAKFHGWSLPATDPALMVCTPSYAAPEMSMGFAVDARSDIYALGLVLYEALIGHNPFINGDGSLPFGQDALMAHILRTPPPVARRRPDVPAAVSALIAQMMAKEPTARPPAMKVVARELRRALRTLRAERAAPRPSQPTGSRAAEGGDAASPQRADAVGPSRSPAQGTTALATFTDALHLTGDRPLLQLLSAAEGAPPLDDAPPAPSAPTPTPPYPLVRPAPARRAARASWLEGPPPERRLAAIALVLLGTMLIGGACGAVASVRLWDLARMPGPWLLYGLIAAGAIAGTAGALLLRERTAPGASRPPSAWILAAGITAGALLGAGATWLTVAPSSTPCAPAPAGAWRPA